MGLAICIATASAVWAAVGVHRAAVDLAALRINFAADLGRLEAQAERTSADITRLRAEIGDLTTALQAAQMNQLASPPAAALSPSQDIIVRPSPRSASR